MKVFEEKKLLAIKSLFYISTMMIASGVLILCLNVINARGTSTAYSSFINLIK